MIRPLIQYLLPDVVNPYYRMLPYHLKDNEVALQERALNELDVIKDTYIENNMPSKYNHLMW